METIKEVDRGLEPLMSYQLKVDAPTVATVPEIEIQLEGNSCRALLDTGCASYIVSKDFVKQWKLPTVKMPAKPVALAVKTEETVVIDEKTAPLTIRVGNEETCQSFFVVDQDSGHDAILGIVRIQS